MNTKLDAIFYDWKGLTYFQAAQKLCDSAETYAELAHVLENMASKDPRIEAFLRVCEQATLASADYEPDAKPTPQGICVWAIPNGYPNDIAAGISLQQWVHNNEPLQFDTKYLLPDFWSCLEDYDAEHEPILYINKAGKERIRQILQDFYKIDYAMDEQVQAILTEIDFCVGEGNGAHFELSDKRRPPECYYMELSEIEFTKMRF